MATHDADKIDEKPSDRRTMTRDPNATGGPIVESGETDKDGRRVTTAGSTHLTTNIDGKWYVCDTRGELIDNKAYETESEAVEVAQKANEARTAVPDVDKKRK